MNKPACPNCGNPDTYSSLEKLFVEGIGVVKVPYWNCDNCGEQWRK